MMAKAAGESAATPTLPLPADLIRVAEIKAVRLQRVTAQSSVRSRRDVKKPRISVNFATKPSALVEGSFRIEGRIEATVSDAARPEHRPCVVIRLVHELEYSVPSSVTATEKDLQIFADTNAVLNIWPYWREVVQHLSMRLDLPPIILPLFRLGKTPTTRPGRAASRKQR